MARAHYIDIQAADGGQYEGYLATPDSPAPAPGLLLIQEIFGVNSHIRDLADAYARQGFVVLAPDVFWRAERNVELGYDPAGGKRGMELRAQIAPEQMVADLQAAVAALTERCNGNIAAIGYCMGGQLVYRLAATGVIAGGVSYYGAGIGKILDQADRITVPMLFHFGAIDKGIPQTEVEAVRAAFAGRENVTINVYENADHGFNCDQRGSYNAEAAKLARERSLSFLRSVL
ncbi:MAG: dienelactone hydrolase family protein [Spongiibacteraceae bacterium]